MALTVKGNRAPRAEVNMEIHSLRSTTSRLSAMPHLRRQPNPHDHRDQGPNGPGSLRTQFQTPPSRHTPSNPTHRHPPSTGPQEVTPNLAPAPVMAHPGSQTNPFSIFRRPRHEQQPPETVEEEEELDDDYDPNVQDEEEIEYDEGTGPGDQFDLDEGIDGQEADDILEDQFDEEEEEEEEDEDVDEEMQDRGNNPTHPSSQQPPCCQKSYALTETLYRTIAITSPS